ncbi:MAG: hypothetical protein K6L81_17770 [Agarilytica sp.]
MSISISQKAKHPDALTPNERIQEAAELLAQAIVRNQEHLPESRFPLDINANQSVHAQHNKAENCLD